MISCFSFYSPCKCRVWVRSVVLIRLCKLLYLMIRRPIFDPSQTLILAFVKLMR